MLSPKLFAAYIQILRVCDAFHCVPHFYNGKTGKLELRRGDHLVLVYLNSFLTFLYTVFLVSQYFSATELIAWNKGFMTSLLSVALTVFILVDIFNAQNLFLGDITFEYCNMCVHYFRNFREHYITDFQLIPGKALAKHLKIYVSIFPVIGTVATVLAIIMPKMACHLCSIVYVYNLSKMWLPFLILLQYYIFLQVTFVIGEYAGRYGVLFHSIFVVVKELRRYRTSLTIDRLRTEQHALLNFTCLKFIVQRLNAVHGQFLLPGHLLATTVIPICTNTAAVLAVARSPLLTIIRKINLTMFSVTCVIYIQTLCSVAGKFYKVGAKGAKQWKVHSSTSYYRKAFTALPPMYFRAGSFTKVVGYTSMKIIGAIIKYTGKVLINVSKHDH